MLLLVNENADPQALAHDWTAIHEFSHLLLPFISRPDAWLSEGMATYYQEVLRARAGLMTEADALERLARGAARLQQCTLSLQTKSQQMATTHDYPVVYWGGATYALLADVELRRRSRGRVTLDAVLRKLHTKHGFQAPQISAKELLKIMDDLAGMEVFSKLADELVYGRPDGSVKAQLQALVETPSIYAPDFERIVRPTQRLDANASTVAKAAVYSGG